jgi:hypothetical protein
MKRIFMVALFYALVASFVVRAETIPPDLLAGSNFIWNLAHVRSPSELNNLKSVSISSNPETWKEISAAHKSLSSVGGTFSSNIDVIRQYYLQQGEQQTIFRIQSNTRGSRFFQLHLMGAKQPPTVVGIIEIEPRKVLDVVMGKQILSIPQGK